MGSSQGQITKAAEEVKADTVSHCHATHLEEANGIDASEGGVEGGRRVVAPNDRVVPIAEDASARSGARPAPALGEVGHGPGLVLGRGRPDLAACQRHGRGHPQRGRGPPRPLRLIVGCGACRGRRGFPLLALGRGGGPVDGGVDVLELVDMVG